MLCITYVQMCVKLGLECRIQVTLAQANCYSRVFCVPHVYTLTVLAEAMVYIQLWFGTRSIGSVKVKLQNCTVPLGTNQTPIVQFIYSLYQSMNHRMFLCDGKE